jgi:hypothetical protein
MKVSCYRIVKLNPTLILSNEWVDNPSSYPTSQTRDVGHPHWFKDEIWATLFNRLTLLNSAVDV